MYSAGRDRSVNTACGVYLYGKVCYKPDGIGDFCGFSILIQGKGFTRW